MKTGTGTVIVGTISRVKTVVVLPAKVDGRRRLKRIRIRTVDGGQIVLTCEMISAKEALADLQARKRGRA